MLNKQRIMTIDAKNLFRYCPKRPTEQEKPFCFNTTKCILYTQVVSQESKREDCPLFYQLIEVIKEVDEIKEEECNDNLLYEKLIILDFGDIFLPIDDDKSSEKERNKKEQQLKNAEDIIENGFFLHFEDKDVLMRPFDKSNNMSRNGRITFIEEKYVEPLNKRLNLEIDFTKVPVVLSKYYAYRGLYLSTSKRVEGDKIEITPETLVILKDIRLNEKPNSRGPNKGEYRPVDGFAFDRDVLSATAEGGEKTGKWTFTAPSIEPIKNIEKPYDGQGVVVPSFSKGINDALKIEGATSFQIRLPFVKGMIHEVDVMAFLNEFTSGEIGEEKYGYEDAFGHERDLKKAKILITESMFKAKKWIVKYCEEKKKEDPKNEDYQDPMKYYCKMLKKYKHALYVSGTNLPYGHSSYTHLSYQTINTLAFNEEQFPNIMKTHGEFIEEPLKFLQGFRETEKNSNEDKDSNENKDRITNKIPNWKKAVLNNEVWKHDFYIKAQLNNIQKGLLTKIATGKILVKGQTRYLCRDLLPIMACLLKSKDDIDRFYLRYLYHRFYMPFGKEESLDRQVKLDYSTYYAFLRNPHLSRNEQCIMKPFVPVEKENYDGVGKLYDKYVEDTKIYHKYFSHLTGVIMLPRGSIIPLCLGGADFDGDLVSVIFDQNVVGAIKTGTYEQHQNMDWWKRKLPAIVIPTSDGEEEMVPQYVTYKHIFNTFSNRIGQISDTAIIIGQKEYSANVKGNEEFDAMKPTCAKCTLLTGLEIDAAKNGIHPNLDLILNNENRSCAYLKFYKKYKKLRSEPAFRVENISVTKEQVLSKEQVVVSATECKTKAKFKVQEDGTYVNRLPVLFYDYYNKNRKNDTKKTVIDVSRYFEKSSKKQKEIIHSFKTECNNILGIYFFYKKIFLNNLTKEKNKRFYGNENLEILIDQMYDRYQAEEIQLYTISSIRKKIEEAIGNDSDIKEIKERINSYQWQFQPYEKRMVTLEKIIGSDFKADVLTDEEKSVLCHFNQQGYKLLWFLMEVMEGPRRVTFDDMKERLVEDRKKYVSNELKDLENSLEAELRQYYDNNAKDIVTKLYDICLEEMKRIIIKYSPDLGGLLTTAALYDATESKNNSDNRKFFWDAFDWEQLKTFVEKG